MELIKAQQKGSLLLDDIKSKAADSGHFHIWWLGQSGYLLQWKGQHLLFDPYLSDALTRKYAETDKPHIRMSELVIAPQLLDFIDVVTSSHNHTDHLDAETLIPLMQANPRLQLLIPEANRAFVANRLKCAMDFPVGLNAGEEVSLGAFHFTGIPAAHNALERDGAGHCKFMGYIVQFGPWTVYHSGDTLWHPELIEALKPFSIDLMLLPINGNRPERRVAGNFNAKEAVALAQLFHARMLIPCHYHLFTFNTVDPDEFQDLATKAGQAHRVLQHGAHFASDEIVA